MWVVTPVSITNNPRHVGWEFRGSNEWYNQIRL